VTKTLLVDGNNLVKIGFHGVKDYYHNGRHIGAIWHFVNTIRRFIDEQNFDKVVVMWDGDDNSSARKLIYPQYKEQRRDRDNEYKLDSFTEQKERIKQYLEDCYIRQINVDNNEADDLIAYYCKISENEQKTIYSGDKDLTQLISDKVSVYYPRTKETYTLGSKIKTPLSTAGMLLANSAFKLSSRDPSPQVFEKSLPDLIVRADRGLSLK